MPMIPSQSALEAVGVRGAASRPRCQLAIRRFPCQAGRCDPLLAIGYRSVRRRAGLLGHLALGVWCCLASQSMSPAADEPTAMESLPLTGQSDPRLAPFDELLTMFVKEQRLPGAALAVSYQGRLVYSRGCGFGDKERTVAVQPQSLFRIASISKPITAVAILQLVDQSRLRLSDKVTAHVEFDPFLPPGSRVDPRLLEVTILQLLQHTAGWDRDASFVDPMFHPLEICRLLKVPPPAGIPQIMRYVFGRPLDFDPGARYAYSNFGYCLLGRVIESVTGLTYEVYVQRHVLAPLGITRMRIGRTLPEGRADGEVYYYVDENPTGPAVMGDKIGAQVPWQYGGWNLEAMDAHGGWIASAPDLVRFASAFDDRPSSPLLTSDAVNAMFARPPGLAGFQADGTPRDMYYGLGWFVRPKGSAGESNQWHTGSLDGTSTLLVRRHDRINWAILVNTRNTPNRQPPSAIIDGKLHEAADRVTEWPAHDLWDAE
ncbi:MAG: serine hydrolase domain-containing protein [Planctomycetales bacterium]